jgi:hypothetical protein
MNLPDSVITRPAFNQAAKTNDYAGAMAFRELDQRIFEAAQARRRGGT